MKKIITFLTAAVMLLALSGCGPETETIQKNNRKGGATLEVDMELAYMTEKASAPSQKYVPILQTSNGVLLKNTNTSGKSRLTHWNAQTGEYKDIERPDPDARLGDCTALRLSGDRFGLMYEKTGVPAWKPDAEAIIEVYDAQLNYTETIEIPALDGDQRLSYGTEFASGTDYLLYEYYYFEGDGGIKTAAYNLETGEVTDISGNGYGIITGASGAAYCDSPTRDGYFLSRIDIQSGRLEPIDFPDGLNGGYAEYTAGSGEYELYMYNGSYVTGLKISDGTGETKKIMDVDASDFLTTIYTTLNLIASPDGRFVIYDGEQLWISHKRTEDEIKNIQPITLAGINLTGDLKSVVVNYNRTHTDYHIFMVDYMDYINDEYFNIYNNSYNVSSGGKNTLYGVSHPDDETTAAVERFRQDLQNGIAPDIICTNNLPYAQFANKGLFLDMTELMEKDERFNPDDYLMNFFDSMKYQGQQQTIAFSFYVNTIIGETELIGEKQGRTAAEYQTMLQNIPEGIDGIAYTRETYRDEFLTWMQTSFLDTQNKTCSFDSPAFASLLEIGKGQPTEEEWLKKFENEGYILPYNGIAEGMLLSVRSFSQAANYHENYAVEHEFRDITLVGFPTESGNGGMFSAPYQLAINAMSAYPDEIWEIFMGMLSEETQRKCDLNGYYSFPVLRSALKEDLEVVTKSPNRTYEKDGIFTSIGAIPMEEQDFLLDYIEHIGMFYYADPTVSGIIREEADMYFAGDQTAQEAANKIQSRASLYISEQY